MKIRRLQRSDVSEIREIDKLSFPAGEQYEDAFYERIRTSAGFEAMVAAVNGSGVVGWILADLTRQPIRIRSLSVHPDFRRRGIGTALLWDLMGRHSKPVDLLVDDGNAAAVALYRHRGFKAADPDPEMPQRRRMVWNAACESATEKWFPLKTKRLLLREFTEADEAAVHEYARDPLVSRYDWWGPAERETWPRLEVNLAMELCSEQRVIGSFRFTIADPVNRTADFGYTFNRNYWNNGYATEAAAAVLDVAFNALKLHRVYATCDTRNIGSWRVMEKLGMRREAHFVGDKFQKGEWRDTYLYAILGNQYTAEIPSGISYRQAVEEDAAGIARLFRSTRIACMPYLPVLHTAEEDLAFFRSQVLRKDEVWIAECERQIAGFCAFGNGWLNHLYVERAFHRRGIGSALLRIAERSNKTLDLWVFQQNVSATKFYEAHGFRLVEKTDGSENEERTPDAHYRYA